MSDDVERKTFECDEVKAADDGHALEGYASVFGNVDGHGDVVVKGAFARTINERVRKGRVPLLLDHRNEVNSILGTVTSAVETSRGLKVKAKLAPVPEADRLRILAKDGHRLSMSIGYLPIPEQTSFTNVDGQMVRELREVKLFEASVVAVGANEEAEVASVKSLFAPVRDRLDELSDEERKAAVAELDELRAELDSDEEPPPVETSDAQPDDEPDGGESGEAIDPEDKSFDEAEWKRRSEALLAGRDPDLMADPAKVAGYETRIDVLAAEIDRALKTPPPADPAVVAANAARLADLDQTA